MRVSSEAMVRWKIESNESGIDSTGTMNGERQETGAKGENGSAGEEGVEGNLCRGQRPGRTGGEEWEGGYRVRRPLEDVWKKSCYCTCAAAAQKAISMLARLWQIAKIPGGYSVTWPGARA